MKVMQMLKAGVAVVGMVLAAGAAFADCNINSGSVKMVRTQPLLGVNLTVGRDVPLGAEIYRQTFTPVSGLQVGCTAGLYSIETRRSLAVTPLPLANWSGTPYAGKVYETGVKGIGVAIWYSGNAMPTSGFGTNCGGGTSSCNWNISSTMVFDLSFIKIGEVGAGTIQGASLPTMVQSFITTNTVEFERVNFSGSINIVSRTCLTSNVNVPMGTHLTNEFGGKNTFTPWQDFSIELNNCPAFNGYYQGTGPRWLSDGTSNNLDSRKSNTLRVRIDPTLPAINPSQGILSLDPSAAGKAPAATGVSVQVADSGGGPLPLSTLRASGIVPLDVEGHAYSIKLKARYIQTEDRITAGPANATATFTIDYY
ncbi:type 1 fimbrial protein [Pseudomonas costantinii]|uniref:fimbrial protein n=1 Tax=Pseudomonas costantinii TaxID=168469 RepID=UPI0015A329AA|nr:fimbrial protein [Pseudomonas costantinii]NVZ18024.1 type 1 fimbrial protein [Pseudomonas costantinii]